MTQLFLPLIDEFSHKRFNVRIKIFIVKYLSNISLYLFYLFLLKLQVNHLENRNRKPLICPPCKQHETEGRLQAQLAVPL